MAFSRPELEALVLFLKGLSGTILAIDDPRWGKPARTQFLRILDWYLGDLLKYPDSAHLAESVRELYRNLDRGLTNQVARRMIDEVFGKDDS